jgi:hypothetical protein
VIPLSAFFAPTEHLAPIVAAVAFVGMIVSTIAGLLTKRFTALRNFSWFFVIGLVVTIVLSLPLSIRRQNGNEDTAMRLVAAIESYRKATGQVPPSLEALVPTHLQKLPDLEHGQDASPYYYERKDGGYELSYVVGFKIYRVYRSSTQSWVQEDH